MADRVNYLAGPEMRATPQKNALAGRVSNAIRAVDEFARKPFGYDNPPAAMLSDALSVPAIYRTLDRIAYGEPLTTGKGQATKLRPDTVETAFTIGPSIIKWPKQVGGAIAAIAGGGVGPDDAMRASSFNGQFKKNDLSAEEISNLISSQRFIDRDLVAKKIKEQDFTVTVTPEFDIFGDKVRAIQDGHHALEAAIRSGNKPEFVVNTARDNDRVGLLDAGKVDDFLSAAYHDSPWYYFATKRDIF